MTWDYNRQSTFQDAVDRVLDTFDLDRSGRNLRQAIASVVDSYREWPLLGEWLHYWKTHSFTSEPIYSTGTVAYTHSGNLLTLTGGTWPANSRYGLVSLAGNRYPVASRTSDTVLVLDATLNPGADVAAGSTYQWRREEYQLPSDYVSDGDLVNWSDNQDPRCMTYVSETDLLIYDQRNWYRNGDSGPVSGIVYDNPEWWTIRKNALYVNGLSIVLASVNASATTYKFTYRARPRELKFEKKEATATTTSGSTAVTGSGFSTDWAGAIIRFSPNNTTEPTPAQGSRGAYNPFTFQAGIASVGGGSSLTLDTAASATLAGVKVVVSDPLDLDIDRHLNAFYSLCESRFASVQRRELYPKFFAQYQHELRLARERDNDFRRTRGRLVHGAF